MCNMENNHVHHSIKFRLDLNGTLPPLTLGSAFLPISPFAAAPCQLTKQPPPTRRKKITRRPCHFLLRDRACLPRRLLTPRDPVPHKVMTQTPTFLSISSEKRAFHGVCVNAEAEHRKTSRQPWRACSNLYSQQVMLICGMAGGSPL